MNKTKSEALKIVKIWEMLTDNNKHVLLIESGEYPQNIPSSHLQIHKTHF